MHCPKCGSENIKTLDTRPTKNNQIRRRKECIDCHYRFSTREIIVEKQIDILKDA